MSGSPTDTHVHGDSRGHRRSHGDGHGHRRSHRHRSARHKRRRKKLRKRIDRIAFRVALVALLGIFPVIALKNLMASDPARGHWISPGRELVVQNGWFSPLSVTRYLSAQPDGSGPGYWIDHDSFMVRYGKHEEVTYQLSGGQLKSNDGEPDYKRLPGDEVDGVVTVRTRRPPPDPGVQVPTASSTPVSKQAKK